MRDGFRALIIPVLAVLMTGNSQSSGNGFSDVHFKKGFSSLDGEQAFALMPQAGVCNHLKFLASFRVPRGTVVTKENKIPAGKPINLWAQTYVYMGESYPGYLRKAYYAITATFTPNVGSSYVIRQEMKFPIHTIEIVDEATGLPPADLVLVKGPYCGGYM